MTKFGIQKPPEISLLHVKSANKTTYLSLEEFLSPKDDS